jgi:indole-3-glycerol phosphate synthase
MRNILREIADSRRSEIELLKIDHPLDSIKRELGTPGEHLFKQALQPDSGPNIIAELKKGSPSKGIIKRDFNPMKLAQEYSGGGAAALSVLTEPAYFFGKHEFLAVAREHSGLPVLCKDFLIDRYQIYYARYRQADAVLLIVSLHTAKSLSDFISIAHGLGMDCLVEVHDEAELEIAIEASADIIGVNNRNLEDFSVTLETSERLAPLIPEGIIRVAESGIRSADDIGRLQQAGFNCFLIGESLVRSDDPAALIRSLRGV